MIRIRPGVLATDSVGSFLMIDDYLVGGEIMEAALPLGGSGSSPAGSSASGGPRGYLSGRRWRRRRGHCSLPPLLLSLNCRPQPPGARQPLSPFSLFYRFLSAQTLASNPKVRHSRAVGAPRALNHRKKMIPYPWIGPLIPRRSTPLCLDTLFPLRAEVAAGS